jgi:hypothetical protein
LPNRQAPFLVESVFKERGSEMNYEHELVDVGSRLGSEAAEHIAQRADDFCESERQRIELSNRAQINALHVEGTRLTKRERLIEERLRVAPHPGNTRSQKRKARFYWFTGILLSVAAFFFSLIAFAPFRLGWYGVLYCLGIAVAILFAVEVFLDSWKNDKLLKAVATLVFLAALGGGALLAAIRGDLLAQQVQQSASPVVIDGENPAPEQPQNSFYESTRGSLRMLMLLLALAIDLGAGVAIHRALLLGEASNEEYEKLENELTSIQERLAAIVFEITALTNAPGVFVARFWRDYYRAMLTQTVRKAATKLLGLSLCLLLLGANQAFGQERLNLVVAVDLSASEAVKGHDGRSQFNKNIQGVTRLLATVPAGSKVTIIGITENSFGQPYILLSADVSDDAGFFGERLGAARRKIVRAWQERAARLEPRARGTDILGALLVASEVFDVTKSNKRKVIVIYSDMLQATDALNLEQPTTLDLDLALATIEREDLSAKLTSVLVYVLGADGGGRKVVQWEVLKEFWTAYFKKCGAELLGYSPFCDPPGLRD